VCNKQQTFQLTASCSKAKQEAQQVVEKDGRFGEVRLCSLLSGDSECAAGSAGGLGLLTSDLESPEVSETSVSSDLLQSFQIFSELGVDSVGDELGPCALTNVSLSVQEPLGNVVI